MARNNERFVYFTIGIPRNSALYQALLHESELSGVSLPKLVPVKLAELYTGTLRQLGSNEVNGQGMAANVAAFLDGEDEQ